MFPQTWPRVTLPLGVMMAIAVPFSETCYVITLS